VLGEGARGIIRWLVVPLFISALLASLDLRNGFPPFNLQPFRRLPANFATEPLRPRGRVRQVKPFRYAFAA
jgi:hypothetical protein